MLRKRSVSKTGLIALFDDSVESPDKPLMQCVDGVLSLYLR